MTKTNQQKIPDFFEQIANSNNCHLHLAENRPVTDYASLDALNYVNQRRLADIVKPGMRVMIAFTDATRACPDEQLISLLVDELTSLGVPLSDVSLLCAVGLHRPMTGVERVAKLGPQLVEQLHIIDHNALAADELVDLGEIDGWPVVTNRHCLETDVLLATGVVEPHQYAGYSGGAKTVVIGCGGEATIQATHGTKMLDEAGVRLGAIEGNPFQAFVRAAGARIGLKYVINVTLDSDKRIMAAAAGAPDEVHNHLIEQAREVYEVPVPQSVHLALAGVNEAKAVNLYQASRAATYLALTDRTPLKPGAPILLPAPIPEGAGQGTGEQRFFDILSRAESPAQLLKALRRTGFPAGAQRAYILAQVLIEHPIIVVGAQYPEVVKACHMHAVSDMAAGLNLAEKLARQQFHLSDSEPLEVLAVPNALLTLPRLAN